MKLLCMHCGNWVSEELSVQCDCGTFCSKVCVDLAHDKMKQVKHHLDCLAALGCEVNIKGLAHEGIFLDVEADKSIPYHQVKRCNRNAWKN
jgi:hypothetical protein